MPTNHNNISSSWDIPANTLEISSSNGTIPTCYFQGITSPQDLFHLFQNTVCYKHSVGFTIFLCVANLLILLIGLMGNCLVIYVVTWKINKRTASSLFIFNLAVADMLVVLFCIPATLLANIFTPWILGEVMCKAVAYAQGVSVFSSVYSLVAISLDRCRAIHPSLGVTQNITTAQAKKIVILIWSLGLTIPLPWTIIFKLVKVTGIEQPDGGNPINFPFCYEAWTTKMQEIIYFLTINVLLCYLLPLGLITVCNVIIWQNVLESEQSPTAQRKLRVLKVFTCLTFAFFLCWFPLYLIMARIKLFYDSSFNGSPGEQSVMAWAIPTAQLLGSCNSCVNPVLYGVLSEKFRETLRNILGRLQSPCSQRLLASFSPGEDNSIGAGAQFRVAIRETAV